jgi:hypothetical protein
VATTPRLDEPEPDQDDGEFQPSDAEHLERLRALTVD